MSNNCKKIRFTTFILLMLVHFSFQAQSSFTLKFFGLTIHPFGDTTARLQPYKLDKKARFVANFGAMVGYEQFLFKDLISVKYIQGFFTDCSAGFAGVSHLGVRFNILQNHKHRIYFGIGPTFFFRESWERFGSDYESSGFFRDYYSPKYGPIQYTFVLYGCEFEWDYRLNDKNAISTSFTPGLPMALTFAVGWKRDFGDRNFNYQKIYIPR